MPALLRKMNTRKVLEAFHFHGPLTRAQLNRRTGISPPTVSKLVAQLTEAGLVEKGEDPVVTDGRPGILFRLASNHVYIIAGIIDVTECSVVAAGLDGKVLEESGSSFQTPKSFAALMKRMESHLRDCAELQSGTCMGIGLTVPGRVKRDSGQVVFSPNMHFLDDTIPSEVLSDRLGIETTSYQEEYALCLGAQMFGQAKGIHNFAVLDLSQGFGMGVVNEDQFLLGHEGYGGEIGHITVEPDGKLCGCGNRGCLETVATDRALASEFSAQLGREVDILEVVRMVEKGELEPGPILDHAIEYVAIGVAAVINIFNPQMVLLHGQMLDLGENVLARISERARARALTPSADGCDIRRTQANKSIGAIAGAIDHLFNSW